MIALASIALAVWEAFSITTHRPTVTVLSTHRPTSALVWGWWLLLGVHLALERKHRNPYPSDKTG